MNRPAAARLLAVALTASFACVGTETPAAAQISGPRLMASHHATYRLTLLKAKGPNAPSTVTGLLDYTFSGSGCDGYKTDFRQMTEMQPAEGDSKVNDMRSRTFENTAATEFDFTTRSTTDDETISDVDGRAKRTPDGKVSVDVKRPAGTATFGAEVLFPTEHLRRIIATAASGERLLSADVYDGSDGGQKLYHTLTVIGAPVVGTVDDAAGQNEATKDLRRWPVVISYFQASSENQPDYVLSADLYENGISRALKLDYGDFTLAGKLVDLSVATEKACAK